MKLRIFFFVLAATTSIVALVEGQSVGRQTRAEMTNYEETSSYADVMFVIDDLVKSGPLVHTESFGTTEEGRELPLLVISDPKVTTPEAAGTSSTLAPGRRVPLRRCWCSTTKCEVEAVLPSSASTLSAGGTVPGSSGAP